MENVLIFQEMLDFSTPWSFKRPKITFLFVLFITLKKDTELVVYNHTWLISTLQNHCTRVIKNLEEENFSENKRKTKYNHL